MAGWLRFLMMLAVLCLAAYGCSESTKPEGVANSTQKGGNSWSSPAGASVGDTPFAPGDRFWVWPVEDRVLEVKDRKVPVKFHWRVRPGQKPPQVKDDGIFAHIYFLSERGGEKCFVFQARRLTLKIGASDDISEVVLDVKNVPEKGEVLFFLGGETAFPKKAGSNLLWLRVRVPR